MKLPLRYFPPFQGRRLFSDVNIYQRGTFYCYLLYTIALVNLTPTAMEDPFQKNVLVAAEKM